MVGLSIVRTSMGTGMAASIDSVSVSVSAATVVSSVGEVRASVVFDIAYFSPVKVEEEVGIEGKVMYNNGMLSAVTVKIRKKGSGGLVAVVGRQWMMSIPTSLSKL